MQISQFYRSSDVCEQETDLCWVRHNNQAPAFSCKLRSQHAWSSALSRSCYQTWHWEGRLRSLYLRGKHGSALRTCGLLTVKGSTRTKNPAPVHEKSYSKKRPIDRYIDFDPRPVNSTPPDPDKFLRDLQELPGTSMWQTLLRYRYQDYELSDDRKVVLNKCIERLLFNLGLEILAYNQDGMLFFVDLSHDLLTTVSGKETGQRNYYLSRNP